MAKIKLKIPDRFVYETKMEVRVNDVNYGGHLGNDSVLTLAHEARMRFLKDNDVSELDIYGTSLIQSDTVIVYKSQAFHGDVLKIEIALDDFSNASFDFYYLISNVQTKKEVARIKTRMVFFDYKKGKLCALPNAFRDKFA